MNKSWQLPRRTFLRGLGTMMALPVLEAMVPGGSMIARAAGAAPAAPKRMAFIYTPNGGNMPDWTPKEVGTSFQLPATLQPLEEHRKEFTVISGLAHDKARANGDGGGDHARASATFLTGCQARKTDGSDIRVGVSVDQVAARKLAGQTRFGSIEIGCDKGQQTGNCDSGYSCAYSYNIAWRSESSPLPPEVNPRLVFDRLFSSDLGLEGTESKADRQRYQKSVLDFVLEDAKKLQSKLGTTDRRKLDEYLTAVRELEQRIERSQKNVDLDPAVARPDGIPQDYAQHIRLMYDLMALSFQTDTTRVATFVAAHDGSNRPYPFIGVPDGHHDLSHHGGNVEKRSKIAKINKFHIEQFAYFLNKMKSIKEGEGSLLDNCGIVYGSGIADGNEHAHHDLPVILAGKGGGAFATGRHVRYAKDTPMTNLFLTMLDNAGVPAERLGDSTGLLKGLS